MPTSPDVPTTCIIGAGCSGFTMAKRLKDAGLSVQQVQLQGDRGHLDGVLNIKQAEGAIRDFLAK